MRTQELCESRGGRPGLAVPIIMVSDVKQHFNKKCYLQSLGAG